MAEHHVPGDHDNPDDLPRGADQPLPFTDPSNVDPGAHPVEQPDQTSVAEPTESRRPSLVLLLAGVVALVVSAASMTGLIPWLMEGNANGETGRWVAVAVVVGVGVALVASPRRRRNHRRCAHRP